jgi:phage shock protein C
MRPRFDRKIAGVCAAFAEHLDLDPSLVRILWVFLTFAAGLFPGLVAYILAWIIIPEVPALPPVPAVNVTATPATGLLEASVTFTTSGFGSTDPAGPV